MEDHKKNPVKKKTDARPWEKMYAGKKESDSKGKPQGKSQGKPQGKAEGKKEKPAKEFRDFLYLLPKKASAKNLAKTLTFIERKDIEIWEDECVLEITTKDGVITFEDIRDSLEKEDEKVLSDLRMKQVISCDYEKADAEVVRKVMDAFLKAFGGKIASDTEDFMPFLDLNNL